MAFSGASVVRSADEVQPAELTAYYDLATSPPTFDFVSFLLYVERERRRLNAGNVDIAVLPGPAGGFRSDRLWPFSIAERKTLLDRVVLPMCALLPSCRQSYLSPRVKCSGASIGYAARRYGQKVFVDSLREIGAPLRPPPAPLANRLVTITLRECEHWPERNSNVPEWIAAAGEIQARGYEVVFVRDTAQASHPLGDGLQTEPEASVDIIKRARLYGRASCNLFVSSGPAWFAMALGVSMIMLRPVHNQSPNRCAHSAFFERCGIARGGQVPGALPSQTLVWASDDRANIVAAFESRT